MPSPFPPIDSTRSCPIAIRARSSRSTARSTGSASLGFDAPSIFGALLDREAGNFRLAPFGINVPASRAYEPGHERARHDVANRGRMGGGSGRAHDGATGRRGRDHAAHASAGRRRRRPHARPDGRCLVGRMEIELICEPVFDYGRTSAAWTLVGDDRLAADATAGGVTIRLSHRHAARDRRRPGAGAPHDLRGRACVLRAVVGGGSGGTHGRRRGGRADRRHGRVLARTGSIARGRSITVAPGDRALGAGDQGSHLHADGRDGRRAHHLAPRDAGRRAQLGLPLHVDPGHDVHAAGAPHAAARLGSGRVHAVRRGRRADRGRIPADHVRDRRSSRPHRDHARRTVRLRRREARAGRQRRVEPAPERRVRCRARLDPAAHPAERAAAATAVADRSAAGRVRAEGLAAARPRHLGGARRAAALRLVQADVLGRDGPCRQARGRSAATRSSRPRGARPPTRSRPTS